MGHKKFSFRAMERVLKEGLEWSVMMIAGLLVLDVLAGVFTRYVLNASLPWTDELGGYLLGWLSFLGAALLCAEDGHISFELLVDSLAKRWQRPIVSGGHLIAVVFFGVVAYQSIYLMSDLRGSFGISVPVPKSLVYSVILLSSIMGMCLLVFRLVATWDEGD